MKLSEIIKVIEKTAPKACAAAWDNCGLQVAPAAAPDAYELSCLALCLDPTPLSVERALNLGAQCVLSHHPLLMQPRLPSVADHYHQVLSLLFRHDAALYAAHTSLDINPHGPAGWLARELGLNDVAIVEETGFLPNMHLGTSMDATGDAVPCGFGLAGTLPCPVSLPALLERLGHHVDMSTATLCGPMPKHVSRVAYCTGSGSSLASLAAAKGADIFITGDVKYHSALESPLCMLDVGHHSLEEEMMRRFAAQLAAELPGLRVEFVASVSPLRPALSDDQFFL